MTKQMADDALARLLNHVHDGCREYENLLGSVPGENEDVKSRKWLKELDTFCAHFFTELIKMGF